MPFKCHVTDIPAFMKEPKTSVFSPYRVPLFLGAIRDADYQCMIISCKPKLAGNHSVY